MNIQNSNRYGKATLKEVQKFENRFGVSIPDEFRNHLLEHNGGSPFPADFDTKDNLSSVHGDFYGLHNGPEYSRLDTNFEFFSERPPHSLMPIASDAFGNKICIGLSKSKGRLGQIYFWDHDIVGEESLEKLAQNFPGFLSKLYEYKDPDESKIDTIVKKGSLSDLKAALDTGYGLETVDEYDRTLIERAAIQARNDLIQYLWEIGAEKRMAISLAEGNAKFFEEHKATVALLKSLYKA